MGKLLTFIYGLMLVSLGIILICYAKESFEIHRYFTSIAEFLCGILQLWIGISKIERVTE